MPRTSRARQWGLWCWEEPLLCSVLSLMCSSDIFHFFEKITVNSVSPRIVKSKKERNATEVRSQETKLEGVSIPPPTRKGLKVSLSSPCGGNVTQYFY